MNVNSVLRWFGFLCCLLGAVYGIVNTLHMFGVEFGQREPEPGMALLLMTVGLIAMHLGRKGKQ